MRKIELILYTVLIFATYGCKKSTINSVKEKETFYKTFDFNIAKTGPSATQTNSGAIVSDSNGNIYCWYFDSVLQGDVKRIAILKTDHQGNIIWNKNYFSFSPGNVVCNGFSGIMNNQDFICIGQSLYICGDSAGYYSLFKFDCRNGSYEKRIPVPMSTNFSINPKVILIWPSKDGNIFLAEREENNISEVKNLYIFKIDTNANVIWEKSDFSYVFLSATVPPYEEYIQSLSELGNGGIIVETKVEFTIQHSQVSITSNYAYRFYQLSSMGALLRVDSLDGGGMVKFATTNTSGAVFCDYNNFLLYGCSSAITHIRILPKTGGGYILVCCEVTDDINTSRCKIFQTDNSFQITDSSYISSSATKSTIGVNDAVANSDGSILMWVNNVNLDISGQSVNLFEYSDHSAKRIGVLGLDNQSCNVSGMGLTADGHVLGVGLITNIVGVNKLFIIKTDSHGVY